MASQGSKTIGSLKDSAETVVLLDDVLLALQKTFSRLSAATAPRSVGELKEMARALIVGEVNFEVSLNVEPVYIPKVDKENVVPEFDKLQYCSDGRGFLLKLSGHIATDVRHSSLMSEQGTDSKG